jgi:hypothetical protein
MDRSQVNDGSAGADTPTLRSSHARSAERTSSVVKVTQAGAGSHLPERHPRGMPPAASPHLIEEAVRVFLALGITATDLRLRARPGSALGELADAMDADRPIAGAAW